jgi:pimeloyl-ACP methyl ester carboxylesterase
MKDLSKIVVSSFILWLIVPSHAQNSIPVQDIKVDVGGYRLQFHVVPGRSPAILFDSGGGDDSSVWRDIIPVVASKTGAQLITYDRAGFGQSDPNPAPYDITHEVEGLERGLKQLQINGGLIPVAHSYGGFLATLFAARNPSAVKGLVLVDANLPSFFTDDVINAMVSAALGTVQQLKSDNPLRADALNRMVGALPETVRIMRSIELPENLKITDILSEKQAPRTNVAPGPGSASWFRAHQEFDKAARSRRGIIATGSGHYIMRDRPELVIDEIAAMFQAVQ